MKTLSIVIMLFSSLAHSKENQKQTGNVINFEEDVIQGERKNLDLFVQIDLGASHIDNVVFQRDNFNDFHQIDSRRRPRYKAPQR